MKLLIDMNLSPDWVEWLAQKGVESVHWSTIGKPSAKDSEIMDWANKHHHIVFTHDLDFGAILAATRREQPSVIQARVQDVSPKVLGNDIVALIKQFESVLLKGALVILDENKTRVRLLPLQSEKL